MIHTDAQPMSDCNAPPPPPAPGWYWATERHGKYRSVVLVRPVASYGRPIELRVFVNQFPGHYPPEDFTDWSRAVVDPGPGR